MEKFLIGILLLAVTLCLYCCIRIGSRADDWMEDHPSPKDGNGRRNGNG